MALQGIRDYAQNHAGQQVLINGGGGGVGSFAIQLAKAADAEVVAVDRAPPPLRTEAPAGSNR